MSRSPRMVVCIDCNEEKLHRCKERCKSCYGKYLYRSNDTWREHVREKNRRYEVEHKEEALERNRAYHERHPEAGARAAKRWRDRNPEALKVAAKEYRRLNPEKVKLYKNSYRAHRHGRLRQMTMSEWMTIKERFSNHCFWCGTTPDLLTQDHVIPLSKGGNHIAWNVVPACSSCNVHKNSLLPEDFVKRRGLDPQRPLFILLDGVN